MKIHREGYLIILMTTALALAIMFSAHWLFPHSEVIQSIAGFAGLVLLILVVQFFRNPSRYTPLNPNHIIAPADGKVVVIEEMNETEFFKDRRLQISIFMSPVNVHVNRNPVSGIIRYFRYHKGKYLLAWDPKSSTDNERTTVVYKDTNGREIMMKQIAGTVARRIVWYIQEGTKVTQGKEMGFIKFGSRVDILLPPGTKINVKLGDTTRGGETVLAEFAPHA